MKPWGKKEIPASRLAVFLPTRPTGNDFLLKGGLSRVTEHLKIVTKTFSPIFELCVAHIELFS